MMLQIEVPSLQVVDWYSLSDQWRHQIRNKVHNKCCALESSRNLPQVHGKFVFHETCPWCQKGWGLWFYITEAQFVCFLFLFFHFNSFCQNSRHLVSRGFRKKRLWEGLFEQGLLGFSQHLILRRFLFFLKACSVFHAGRLWKASRQPFSYCRGRRF